MVIDCNGKLMLDILDEVYFFNKDSVVMFIKLWIPFTVRILPVNCKDDNSHDFMLFQCIYFKDCIIT